MLMQTTRAGLARAVLLVAALCAVEALHESMQAFSYEEADGAIATAEQHIVQEQSHIIETLNKKLAKMKADLEIEQQANGELREAKGKLEEEVSTTKSTLENTRQTALENQKSLQTYIDALKKKESEEHTQLQLSSQEVNTLKSKVQDEENEVARLRSEADDANERYHKLLQQKQEAIQRAKEKRSRKFVAPHLAPSRGGIADQAPTSGAVDLEQQQQGSLNPNSPYLQAPPPPVQARRWQPQPARYHESMF